MYINQFYHGDSLPEIRDKGFACQMKRFVVWQAYIWLFCLYGGAGWQWQKSGRGNSFSSWLKIKGGKGSVGAIQPPLRACPQ